MNTFAKKNLALPEKIRDWGRELGFQQVGFGSLNLAEDEEHLARWLEAGHHGSMEYMERHGAKRSRPRELVPGSVSVISVRMDYLPDAADSWQNLRNNELAYVSRYALGRDYHKLLRPRLAKLAEKIRESVGEFGYRVFVDSAPVMEKALARNSGLGWIGKHSNLINRTAGSWFFLGEIFVDIPLPPASPVTDHCGSCTACLDVCPTQAIIAPYQVDARRCISYLTIENKGAIPVELRSAILGLTAEGGTAIGDAISLAGEELARNSRTDAGRIIVLMTDGQSNSGKFPTIASIEVANEGVKIFSVGYGVNASTSTLRIVASTTSGEYFRASTGT